MTGTEKTTSMDSLITMLPDGEAIVGLKDIASALAMTEGGARKLIDRSPTFPLRHTAGGRVYVLRNEFMVWWNKASARRTRDD